MARSKKRDAKKARNLDALGMILGCKAKSWDARDRRSKDARKLREHFETYQ